MSVYAYTTTGAYLGDMIEIKKVYDLASGYLGEMPIATIKLADGKKYRVYSAECLLNDIEREKNVHVMLFTDDVAQFADENRKDVIL